MADQIISLRIPSEKVTVAMEGFLKIYPNIETIDDPTWVDPKDGSEVPQIPKYTNKQWITEKIRRIIVRDIYRGLQLSANEAAVITKDSDIVII